MIQFTQDGINIPLLMKGIISYFQVRTPTQKEVDECFTLEATAENIEWELYSTEFQRNEGHYVLEPTPIIHRHLNYIASENDDISDTINRNLSSITSKETQLYMKARSKQQLKDSFVPLYIL
jgi:hypothetical protein